MLPSLALLLLSHTRSYLGGYWWLPHIGFGVMIFWYTEHSKKLTRANPDGWWARHMQW